MRAQLLVARNLRRLRVAQGLSQEALAVDANVDRTYVGRLERGIENPTIGVLEKIARALTVPMSSFFDEEAARVRTAPLKGGRRPR